MEREFLTRRRNGAKETLCVFFAPLRRRVRIFFRDA